MAKFAKKKKKGERKKASKGEKLIGFQ